MSNRYFTGRYARIFLRGAEGAALLALYTKKRLSHTPRSIVIVQSAQLGDMVCMTPVFRAIKKHLSDTKLILVGSKGGEGIISGNTDIDQYIVLDERHPEITARLLQAEKPEAGIVIVPSLDSLLLLATAHIPYIVVPELVGGYSPANTRLYRFLSAFVVRKPHVYGNYAAREYLRLLEPFGIIEDDTTKHLSHTVEAYDAVRAFLTKAGIDPSKHFVCIAPGAGNKVKQWPAERFAAVADHIWKTYQVPTVLLGSSADQEEVDAMRESLGKDTKYADSCGVFSLDETKALIAHAHLLIAADTMAIYIAEAFNTQLIDIVGPIDEREQPPTGKGRIIIVPPGDRVPQMHVMNARVYDFEEVRRQATATTVEMVTKAADTLLS